jgi:hypothetical protein
LIILFVGIAFVAGTGKSIEKLTPQQNEVAASQQTEAAQQSQTTEKERPQQQAKEEKKEPPPPPPTPAIGEKISSEYFQYIKKQRHWECQEAIVRRAEYGIRAPGLIYGTSYNADVYLRFSRMSVMVDGDGNMNLAGDEAEAQNGAGTWVGVKYFCTINVNTLEVRDVALLRGRFID